MPEPPLQIAREGVVLGSLPEREVRELLTVGFLRPEDCYWFVAFCIKHRDKLIAPGVERKEEDRP